MKSAVISSRSVGEKAIVEAAIRLFSQAGFDGVSMRSIAAAAGVSKANIYHHFGSKQALYQAIIQQSAAELSVLVEGLEESDGELEVSISEFAEAHLKHLLSNELTSRLMLREAFSRDGRRNKMMADQVVGGIFQRMLSIFSVAQQAGVLRADLDPALCATLLMGCDIFFFQAQGVLKHIPEADFSRNPSRFSREMVEIMLRGMMHARAADGGAK